MTWERAIKEWMTVHSKDGIELLQKMIRAESLAGQEHIVQEMVAEQLRLIGLKVDVWEPDGIELTEHPYFCSNRGSFSGSPNVVGVWEGSDPENGLSLILNGHVDVVPVGDLSQWTEDPWSGKLSGNRVYGRGSTDMKGGIVSSLLAVQCLKELGIQLAGSVIVESVIDEESGGAGTLSTLLRGYKADAAIIPEPTNLAIFPKQQGSVWFRVTVTGRSAHGGTRYQGISAIEKSQRILAAIQELEQKRNERITDELYRNTPIPVPINVGSIAGGNWPSSVPDKVVLEGRMGVAPNERIEDAKKELTDWIQHICDEDEWLKEHPASVDWFGAMWLPGEVGVEHQLVHALKKSYRDVMKNDPTIIASPWGTDGGLLQTVGNIPAIIFGPGQTNVAHYPNEYVEIDKVFQCAEILALAVLLLCEKSTA